MAYPKLRSYTTPCKLACFYPQSSFTISLPLYNGSFNCCLFCKPLYNFKNYELGKFVFRVGYAKLLAVYNVLQFSFQVQAFVSLLWIGAGNLNIFLLLAPRFCKRRGTLFISLLSWLAVEVLSPCLK